MKKTDRLCKFHCMSDFTAYKTPNLLEESLQPLPEAQHRSPWAPKTVMDANTQAIQREARKMADRLVIEAAYFKMQDMGDPSNLSDADFARLLLLREVVFAGKKNGLRIAMKAVETFIPKKTETGELQKELLDEMLTALRNKRAQGLPYNGNGNAKQIEAEIVGRDD